MAKRKGVKMLMLNLAIMFSILSNNLSLQVKIQDAKNGISDDLDLQASISDLASIFKNQVQEKV
jgi:hypothetical protein